MAGFHRLGSLMPSVPVADDWVTRAVPMPQVAHGRVYDPMAVDWAPQVTPYRIAPDPVGFSDTGFADYLRGQYTNQRRAPMSSLADLLMWWQQR